MKKWCTISSFLFVVAILILGCTVKKEAGSRVEELPFYADATYTPSWINPDEIPEGFHQIPAFELHNQSGRMISESDLDNKVTVVDFFFTSCPGICPKMTSNMMMVQEAFPENGDVQILSHSVTPEYDSIPVLRDYADLHQIKDGKWHLLTGDRSVIYDLGRNQYFIEEDLGLEKDPDDFIHTENFVLIDQQRRIRGIYNGLNKSSVRQLIADVATLLKS